VLGRWLTLAVAVVLGGIFFLGVPALRPLLKQGQTELVIASQFWWEKITRALDEKLAKIRLKAVTYHDRFEEYRTIPLMNMRKIL
jgi:hypothetical protein